MHLLQPAVIVKPGMGGEHGAGKVEVKYQDKFLTKTVEGRLPGGKAAEMAEGNPPPTVLLRKAKEG